MAQYNNIISTFSGGLVAKSLYGRIDLERVKNSGRKFNNFFPTIQGPADYRQGFKYQFSENANVENVASASVTLSNDRPYQVYIFEGVIKVYDDTNTLKSTINTDVPYLASQLKDLRFSSEVDRLIIAHPQHRPRVLSAEVSFEFNNLVSSDGFTLQSSEGTDANSDGQITGGEVTGNLTLQTSQEIAGDDSWVLSEYPTYIEPYLDKDTSGALVTVSKGEEIARIESTLNDFSAIASDYTGNSNAFTKDWWVEFDVDGKKALGRVVSSSVNYPEVTAPTNTVVFVDSVDFITEINDQAALFTIVDNVGLSPELAQKAKDEGVPSDTAELRSDTAVFNASQTGSFIRIDPAKLVPNVNVSTVSTNVRWIKVARYEGQESHPVDFHRGSACLSDASTDAMRFHEAGSVYRYYGSLSGTVDVHTIGATNVTLTDTAVLTNTGNRVYTWQGGGFSTNTGASTDGCVGNMSTQKVHDIIKIDTDASAANNGVKDTVTGNYIKIEQGTNLIVPAGITAVTEVANDVFLESNIDLFSADTDVNRYFKGELPESIVYAKIVAYSNQRRVRASLRSPVGRDATGEIENKGMFLSVNFGAFYQNNFPSTVAKFERRRVFGGTQTNPNYVFMSRVDNETDFSPISNDKTLLDTDGISYQLSNVNASTQWMVAAKDLVIGTTKGLFRVVPNQYQYAVSPKTIRIELVDDVNCNLDAKLLGTSLFFPDASGSQLMEYKYDGQIQQSNANNMAKFIHPTFLEDNIIKVVVQEIPQPRVLVLTTSGKLYCLTYQRQEDFYSWNEISTSGIIKDVSVSSRAYASGADMISILVKRTLNNIGYNQHESLFSDLPTEADTVYYLDGACTGTVGVAGTVSGHHYNNGATVAAVVNGVYKGEFTVASGVLDGLTASENDTYAIGIRYTGELQMMYPAWESASKSAYGQRTSRVVSQKLFVVDSYKYKVVTNGQTETFYLPGFTANSITLPTAYTGFDKERHLPGATFGDSNTPVITQDEPYQLTVASILTKSDMS
jgi:hypothetical protein